MILLPVFLRNILSAKITAWVDTTIRIALPVWTMNCRVALRGANRAHNLAIEKIAYICYNNGTRFFVYWIS